MRDTIESQLELLQTYKGYNYEKAMGLNRGTPEDFYRALMKYEEELMENGTKAFDDYLEREYEIDDSMDDEWDEADYTTTPE